MVARNQLTFGIFANTAITSFEPGVALASVNRTTVHRNSARPSAQASFVKFSASQTSRLATEGEMSPSGVSVGHTVTKIDFVRHLIFSFVREHVGAASLRRRIPDGLASALAPIKPTLLLVAMRFVSKNQRFSTLSPMASVSSRAL
jgi:hypothetical protein